MATVGTYQFSSEGGEGGASAPRRIWFTGLVITRSSPQRRQTGARTRPEGPIQTASVPSASLRRLPRRSSLRYWFASRSQRCQRGVRGPAGDRLKAEISSRTDEDQNQGRLHRTDRHRHNNFAKTRHRARAEILCGLQHGIGNRLHSGRDQQKGNGQLLPHLRGDNGISGAAAKARAIATRCCRPHDRALSSFSA